MPEHPSPLEFGGSQKWGSLISAYQSLAITTKTPGFEKLNTALTRSRQQLNSEGDGIKSRISPYFFFLYSRNMVEKLDDVFKSLSLQLK